MAKQVKARNWVGVLYPENMISHWQDRIYRKLQIPFEYIIHDRDQVEIEEDVLEPRKVHVHLVGHWPGPTTYNNVLQCFNELSKTGFHCLNKVEPVRSLKYMHRYLTHETEDAKKQNKFLYPRSEIITGNNWDLGAFIELEDNDSLYLYRTIRDFMCQYRVVTVLDLERSVEWDEFDEWLPDFEKDTILKYIKNNRRLFVEIAKEINFKYKKEKEC